MHNHHWKGKKLKQISAKIHPCLVLFNIIDESIQAFPTETLPNIPAADGHCKPKLMNLLTQ